MAANSGHFQYQRLSSDSAIQAQTKFQWTFNVYIKNLDWCHIMNPQYGKSIIFAISLRIVFADYTRDVVLNLNWPNLIPL